MAELSIKNSREEILENLDVNKIKDIYKYVCGINIYNEEDLRYLFNFLNKINYIWRDSRGSLLNESQYNITKTNYLERGNGCNIALHGKYKVVRGSLSSDSISLETFLQIVVLLNNQKSNITSFNDNYSIYTSSANSKFQKRYKDFKQKYLKKSYEMIFVNIKDDTEFDIQAIFNYGDSDNIIVFNCKNLDMKDFNNIYEVKNDEIILGYIFKNKGNIFINYICEDLKLDDLFDFFEQIVNSNSDISRRIFNKLITEYNKVIDIGDSEKKNKISTLENDLNAKKHKLNEEMKKRHQMLLMLNNDIEEINKNIQFEMAKKYEPISIQHKLIKHIEVKGDKDITVYTEHLFINQYNRSKLIKKIKEYCNENGLDDELVKEHSFDKYINNLDDILNSENIFYLGCFKINIDIKSLNIEFRNLNNTRRSYWSSKDNHPHIDNYGKACMGNLSEMVSDVIAHNDLNSLMIILIDFLQSANVEDGAGKFICNWDLVNKNTLTNVLTGKKMQLEEIYIKE